jgi:excisionase family DNA binding protein
MLIVSARHWKRRETSPRDDHGISGNYPGSKLQLYCSIRCLVLAVMYRVNERLSQESRPGENLAMTVKQAAAKLEVSVATTYALVAAGKLKCVRIGLGRGAIRITDDHIAEYLYQAQPMPSLSPSLTSRRVFKHIKIHP